MTERLVALRIRVAAALHDRREAGQGTLEYIGAILVAAVVVAAVATAFREQAGGITSKVSQAISDIFSF